MPAAPPCSEPLTLSVPGAPRTRGNLRVFSHRATGRVFVADRSSRALRAWMGGIRAAAETARRGAAGWAGPVGVDVTFRLGRPQRGARGLTWHPRRPDLDKLVRAVLDALTGVAYADDGQVARLHARKVYTGETPGVEVTVAPLDPTETP